MKRVLEIQRAPNGHRVLDLQNTVADEIVYPPEGQTISDAAYDAWLESDDALPNILVRATALVNGVPTIFRWSTLGITFGGATAPVFYDPIVSTGIPFSVSLSLEGTAGITTGDLEIDNADGVNEHLRAYEWRGQQLETLKGDIRWNEADYRRTYIGVSGGLSAKNDRTLALYQRDMTERLNAAMTEHRLGGDGPSQDTIIPLAFGECHNVTGLLTDAALLRRQFHDGQIEGIRLRTNGLPTYDFDVNFGAGTVDLGVNNESATITASVQGDKYGGIYRRTIASLIRRIVTGFGDPANRYTDADIDLENFAAFDAAHPELVGMYISDRTNVLVACNMLASSVGAQLSPSLDGKLRLIQIAIPAAGVSTDILPEHILQGTLRPVNHIARVDGVALNFCRNYTVQAGLQTAISDERKALFEKEWLTEPVGAGDPKPRDTQLMRRVDVRPQALREFDLWGVDREVYEFVGLAPMTRLKLGQPIRIFNDLYGMENGVDGQVLTLAPDPDERKRHVTVGILV